ncbi:MULTISPECIES: AAA family ATPase [unclassified Pseudarthrobacter]|uniref:AAA family ATPase n=1 Tax=unclassified Pseudarthrobacter TaxID=2647000 RepID=UPI0030788D70
MEKQTALQPRIALFGMRSNAGPLDNVTITFSPGVTSLYGQNGAGKTWILDALRHTLRGHATGITQLFCEFEPGSPGYKWTLDQVARAARDSRPSDATLNLDRKLLREAIEAWFDRGGRYLKTYYNEGDIPSDLVDELATVTTFAFIPTGDLEPNWDIWLCMPRDMAGFPACARVVANYCRVVEEAAQAEERHMQEFAALESGELGDLTDEQYDAKYWELDQRFEKEVMPLAWDPLYEPLAALLWEYAYRPDPGTAQRWMAPMLADNFPIPMVKLFASQEIPLVLEDDEDATDVDAATAKAFAAAFGEKLSVAEDSLALTDSMKQWAVSLNDVANDVYASLLQDAPRLTLEVRKLGRWAVEGAMHWHVAYGDYGSSKIPLARLSRSETRWARIAVRRALDLTGATTALIIDEPEAALHRAAERHMARGLDGLTTLGPQVVVATHSPEVLNAQTTGLIHVSKVGNRTSVGQIPALEPETLEKLGLSPSDLLGLYRIFLLVEGEHDEVVIQALCGDFLEAARVKIIPVRGGSNLPGTVESHVLFDLSDAHLVAVLDNVHTEEITAAWVEAQTRYLSGDGESAIEYLDSEFKKYKGKKGKEEYGWIGTWLSRALKKGVAARMNPWGLMARDIIEYLPVEVLVPNAGKSWDELRHEHDTALPSLDRTKRLHEFKTWLEHAHGADTSVSNVRRAAASATEVPEEFQKLGYRLREISSRPRNR